MKTISQNGASNLDPVYLISITNTQEAYFLAKMES